MRNLRDRCGQAMLEYVLVFTALIVLCSVLCYFAAAARRASENTTELVTSEYP